MTEGGCETVLTLFMVFLTFLQLYESRNGLSVPVSPVRAPLCVSASTLPFKIYGRCLFLSM